MDGAIFIIVPHLSGSRRIREVLRSELGSIKTKVGRERGLAGGELVAVVQLPINLSHT